MPIAPADGPAPRARFAPVLAAALAMAPHLPLLLGTQALIYDDARMWDAPYAKLTGTSLCAGRIPMWNPYQGVGTPSFADPMVGTLYPDRWLACALAPDHVVGVSQTAHVGLLAAGLALLLLELGVGQLIAIAAAAALALCGPAVSWMSEGAYLRTLAWLPLALLDARRAGLGRPGAAPRLGLWIGLAALAGDVPGGLIIGLIAGGVWLSTAGRRLRPGPVAVAGGLALMVGAAAWLPLLWFVPRSARAAGLVAGEAGRWSLHPGELLGLIWPNPLGLPLPENTFWPFGWMGPRTYVHSLYVGAALAGFGVIGLWRFRREPFVRAVAIAALLLIVIATGNSTPLWVVIQPIFSLMRYPSKLAAPAMLLLGIVGAVAIDRALTDAGRGVRTAAVIAALTLLGAVVGPPMVLTLGEAASAPAELAAVSAASFRDNILRAGALAAVLAMAFAWAARHRTAQASRRATWVAALVLVLDGAVAGQALEWTAPPAVMTWPAWLPAVSPWGPRVVRAGELDGTRLHRDQIGYLRSWRRHQAVLKPLSNLELPAGVLEGYGLLPGETSRNLVAAYQASPTGLMEFTGTDVALVPMAPRQRWAVDGLADGRLAVIATLPELAAVALRATQPLPRAYLSPAAKVVPPGGELAALAAREYQQSVVVTGGEALIGGARRPFDPAPIVATLGGANPNPTDGTFNTHAVVPTKWTPEAFRFDVNLPEPALLVVMDAFSDGWHARIDGAAAPILRANLLGRAVLVPAGHHTVQMHFDVPLFWIAAAATLVGVAWAILAATLRIGRRQKRCC